MDTTRQQILQTYHVDPSARLSQGMEAEVFAYNANTVFKLYAGTTSIANLAILRDFYTALDRDRVPYALPRIYTIADEAPFLISIEQRLPGVALASVLPALRPSQLDAVMQRYLAAALALAQIAAPPSFERYQLFDPDQRSTRHHGDWHRFLSRSITQQLGQVAPALRRDVPDFDQRVQQLLAVLAQPYQGSYQLIHGDFFPGNLLVNENCQITALLDFGMLTMYGDPLFDLATGWVFFDMYDELKANIFERYLALLLERLGEHARGKLYRYVLIYSILSANTYSRECADGHYRWCAANLRNATYWNGLE